MHRRRLPSKPPEYGCAPVKGFYIFAESAHSPIFEEPEKMREYLRQGVLTGATTDFKNGCSYRYPSRVTRDS